MTERGGFPSLTVEKRYEGSRSNQHAKSDHQGISTLSGSRDSPDIYFHRRSIKRRHDVVNWNGVEWIRSVATDVRNYAQPSARACGPDRVKSNERGDRRRQIDAVDEHVDWEMVFSQPPPAPREPGFELP